MSILKSPRKQPKAVNGNRFSETSAWERLTSCNPGDAVMALGRVLQLVSCKPRAEAFLLAHDFIEREWKPHVLTALKSSTQSSYHANLNRYVVPWLQDRRIRDVRRSDVQGWLAALSQSGLAR